MRIFPSLYARVMIWSLHTIDRRGWATVAPVVIGALLYQWAGAS